MKLGRYFRPSSAFLLFFLISCTSVPIESPPATQQQPLVSSVSLPGVTCKDIVIWHSSFLHQYPRVDLAIVPPDYNSMPQVANMFRDSTFLPLFRFTYNVANAEKLSSLRKLVTSCREATDIPEIRKQFDRLESFHERTLTRVDPILAQLAGDNNRREELLHKKLLFIEALENRQESLEQIDAAGDEVKAYFTPLWPHELESFVAIAAARKREIANAIGLPQDSAAAPIYSETGSIESRVAERVGVLEKIPLTLEGRQQTVDWMLAFDRDFLPYDRNETVMKARMKWIIHREKIFKATKSDFTARLAKLPAGEGSELSHERLLSETFPLPSDKNMPVYRDYLVTARSHQKPLSQRSMDKGFEGLKSIRDWLSDAARSITHGSSPKAP